MLAKRTFNLPYLTDNLKQKQMCFKVDNIEINSINSGMERPDE